MSWICPSCNKSTCVGCEPVDNAMPRTHEILCACTDSCAKDAEIERLRAKLRRIDAINDHPGRYNSEINDQCRIDEQSMRREDT